MTNVKSNGYIIYSTGEIAMVSEKTILVSEKTVDTIYPSYNLKWLIMELLVQKILKNRGSYL